jgi:fatty-acyl-CoA synthase
VADSDAVVAITGQELRGQVRPLLEEGLRLGAGLQHVVVAAYSDYLTQPTDLKIPEVVTAPRQPLRESGVTEWKNALAEKLEPAVHQAGPDDLCVMPYTSGTTGNPKGCIHTHRTVMSTTVAGGAWVDMQPETVILCSMPLFHVTGMQCSMNQPIYFGATIVLMTRWDRDTAGELIERHKIEGWTNIATMAIDFLSNPNLGRYDISSMKHIGGGGAAMPEAVAQRLYDLTGLTYIEGYGLSETIARRSNASASRSVRPLRWSSIRIPSRYSARARPAKSFRMARRSFSVTGRIPRPPPRRSSTSAASHISVPATWAIATRTVIFSSSTASNA